MRVLGSVGEMIVVVKRPPRMDLVMMRRLLLPGMGKGGSPTQGRMSASRRRMVGIQLSLVRPAQADAVGGRVKVGRTTVPGRRRVELPILVEGVGLGVLGRLGRDSRRPGGERPGGRLRRRRIRLRLGGDGLLRAAGVGGDPLGLGGAATERRGCSGGGGGGFLGLGSRTRGDLGWSDGMAELLADLLEGLGEDSESALGLRLPCRRMPIGMMQESRLAISSLGLLDGAIGVNVQDGIGVVHDEKKGW